MIMSNIVKLVLPTSLLIHPIVNISQVKCYYDTLEGQPTLWSNPVVVTEDYHEEYEVDYIAASCVKQ